MQKLPFLKLKDNAKLPVYATSDAAGMDLSACLDSPICLEPGQRCVVPTGLAMALPRGYEGQVRPRSGLAAKHGVTVLNAPGTIDSDYRGEIGVLLINHGTEHFVIEHGARIAQLVVAPYTQVETSLTTELGETARGEGGFGSTGV